MAASGFYTCIDSVKEFSGRKLVKTLPSHAQDSGARRRGVQKPQGDPETPRLSDLVMTLGEFVQGVEGLLLGHVRLPVRIPAVSGRRTEGAPQKHQVEHCPGPRVLSPAEGRGSAHTISLQASLSKAPWPLPAWLPEPCRSLQGQGPGRPRTRGTRPSQSSLQDPDGVLCAGLPGPRSSTRPPPRGLWGSTMRERQLQLGKAGSPGFTARQQQENMALTNRIRTDLEPLFSSKQMLQGRTPQKPKRSYSLGVWVPLAWGELLTGKGTGQVGQGLPGRLRNPPGPHPGLPAPEPPPQSWGDRSR